MNSIAPSTTQAKQKAPFKRQAWLYIAIVLTLLGALTTGWLRMNAAQDSAQAAAESSNACEVLAVQIQQLKNSPTLASTGDQPVQDLARRIEQAAQQVNIPVTNIVRIWPQEPRRVDSSPYKQKGTLLVVRGISLQQATSLLHQLDAHSRNLSVSSIRLSATRESNDQNHETWTLEATLSTLIYAPHQS